MVTNFTYNTNIPAATNNPSNDQPLMLTNFNSINSIWNVDHYTFQSSGINDGTHKQVTLSAENVPGSQTDPVSVFYTNAGTASTVAQPFYRNANSIFHMLPIKAWGYATPAGVSNSQSFNVSSIVRKIGQATGVFTVTLTTNAVSSANFGVLVTDSVTNPGAPLHVTGLYANTAFSSGSATFDLWFRNTQGVLTDPATYVFSVLQI